MLGFAALGGLPLGGFQFDDHIYCEYGQFVLTGENATLVKFVGVVGAAGSYVLTGQDAQFTRTVFGNTGVFVLSGQAAGLDVSMPAAVGAFTLTGIAAGLDTSLRANAGSFAVTGRAETTVEAARVLYALPTVSTSRVEFLLGGAPLGGVPMGGDPDTETQETTFLLTGRDVTFQRVATLVASVGTFTLSGQDAGLLYSGIPSNIRAFPRVSKSMRTQQRGGLAITATSKGRGFGGRVYGG